MQLSDTTLDILRNYSAINQNLLIEPGNAIKTVNESRTILSTATIAESFPKEIGIYDLNEFIGAMSLVQKPTLDFKDEYITLSDESGRASVKYFTAAKETLTKQQKTLSMPEADVKFKLDNDTFNKLKKAASTLGHKELSITAKDGVLSFSVIENQHATSNAFSIDIDGEFKQDAVFNFILNISNIKILAGDYDVEISSKLITQFKHKGLGVTYWIALEKSSTYGA